MDKDKQLITVESNKSLIRVGSHLQLVGKVLSDNDDIFLPQKKLILVFERENDKPLRLEVDKNLQELDLSGRNIKNIPSEIGLLSKLTSLNFKNNAITYLPIEIGQLSNLASLYLPFNKLIFLPTEIGQLSNLTSLDLRKNKLISLPAEIGQLYKLTSLRLSSNQLTCLPIVSIRATPSLC